MTMPNFLVIGTAKAGTDALCHYLGQHPQVFVSANKEPLFFVAEGRSNMPYRGPGDRETLRRHDMWISSRVTYESLFAAANGAKAIGEGSTWYLYDESAPIRIHRDVPGVKMIAVLRNPADRAYSAFTMLLRDGRETTTNFVDALEAEDGRVRTGWEPIWHYRRMGFYHEQLTRYLSLFDRTQIHVVLYDDFAARPLETLAEIFHFLGVDDSSSPDVSERLNVSLVPEHASYHRLVNGHGALKGAGR
ncbi:MAG TPA: sulfotransferase, partial [Candidatus Dormibacteraeota bacterium]|nr:sulfotransferase [Candidatus Dormibacteraeota bacterium]